MKAIFQGRNEQHLNYMGLDNILNISCNIYAIFWWLENTLFLQSTILCIQCQCRQLWRRNHSSPGCRALVVPSPTIELSVVPHRVIQAFSELVSLTPAVCLNPRAT